MVTLRPLDRKVIRDLLRLWSQVLAIALVMACGVMTIILAVGAFRALEETRDAYYERNRFAHVFAATTRAPDLLTAQIRSIDGVAAASTLIKSHAILDVPGMNVPASAMIQSIPDSGQPQVNRLFVRQGRLPQLGARHEIALDERFAAAHGYQPGDRIAAILKGKRLELVISAIVLSPEYIYTLGPGDMFPDARRFAVIFMPDGLMAALSDMEGAFNSVVVRLQRGACEACVIDKLDRLLAPYGAVGAHGREAQISHAFLSSEMSGLEAMARIIPPIFLLVSAFLVNMILSRLIALEREQIGLLKACGYSAAEVGWHYGKLVVLIATLGLGIGMLAGGALGRGLAQMYAEFFTFPYLLFRESADLYAIAAGVSVASALAGAGRAIWSAARLPPAVAMRPPAPERFRRGLSMGESGAWFSRLAVMAMRHVLHHPTRAILTSFGAAFAVALLVVALFMTNAMEHMIDTVFFRAERADARIDFAQAQPPGIIDDLRRLPGVRMVETFRVEPVFLRHGPREERQSITGRAPGTQLSRVLGPDDNPVSMPQTGILLSQRLATKLDAMPGDVIEVELSAQGGRVAKLRVAGIVSSYLGPTASMSLSALDRLAGTGPRVSGAWVAVDPTRLDALYAQIKVTPQIATLSLQTLSRQNFQDTMAQNINLMTTIYTVIAVIVAFGVVYNAARIQLSERARELASLRVFGFTRAEVFRVLLLEILFVVMLAQPLGWAIGYGFSRLVVMGFDSDLFTLPFVINPAAFAFASTMVLGAGIASVVVVRRRVNRLDLIRVLKTRE